MLMGDQSLAGKTTTVIMAALADTPFGTAYDGGGMMMRSRLVAAMFVLLMAIWTVAAAQTPGDSAISVRHVTRVDESGVSIERQLGRFHVELPSAPQPVGAGIIWHLNDGGSITESVDTAFPLNVHS